MKPSSLFLSLTLVFCVSLAPIIGEEAKKKPKAEVSSLKPSDIREFDEQPEKIQKLLTYALDLTTKDLAYIYGGSSPSSGGMDCSGTVSHILKEKGYSSPRQCNTIYLWVEKRGNMHRVEGATSLKEAQFKKLKPGDLLFWEGTYNVGKRTPPTSHVMIYLGHKKANGKPVMVGASSGRYYEGKARHGVSIFDFQLPRKSSKAQFVGFGAVPGLEVKEKAAEQKPKAKVSFDTLNLPKARRIILKKR